MKLRSAIILLLLACAVSIQSKAYVVCVGIADYPGKENDLRISDNDAQTIAKVFQATKDATVSVLVNESATQSALLSTMHAVFADAQSDDAVIFETQYKNSLFTIYLERGLRGGADNDRNRQISAREIFDFVHDGVTKASSNKQHPVMWGKFDDNMTIIKW